MSVNGRFNNTDCLPVTGKDGKTQWIFKLEDLREVAADGYLSLLRTTREDLEDVISKGESGLGKKEILIKLKRIRQNINNNL